LVVAHPQSHPLEARIEALSPEHQRGIARFRRRVLEFVGSELLSRAQGEIVCEHLIRLGERGRNPANTGNIEDLFCYTLTDTGDPIRAFAQALADSVKVVPMDDDAKLRPAMRRVDKLRWYRRVRDFDHLSAGDRMLVTHTMVAYGDDEMAAAAKSLIAATRPNATEREIERDFARMVVQSQHLPSSTFVLARARGLTIDCEEVYRQAEYSEQQIADAQAFYDICAEFEIGWAEESFLFGNIPVSKSWSEWRARYLDLRTKLPAELIYQLSSDTLTNFLDGTLESGKWTDASVFFGGASDPTEIPTHLARIVNQYIAEHVALHDRPAKELTVACAEPLRPWGIGFKNDRAVVLSKAPEKADRLKAQFDAAWAQKTALDRARK
jgi:hypothetical protein